MGTLDLTDISSGQCLVVAEIAQAHDGSLGTAHAYIDAVARAGATAVKFQTHIADAESLPSEPWRVRFSRQDQTRFAYWRRMEFTEDQWRGLAAHAAEAGLHFLSTPFSMQAVDMLERLGMPAWKIGSGDVDNLPLIKRVASTGLPVLLSSGMSSWASLDRAVEIVNQYRAPLAVLQCTTSYPCPPEKIGLNLIAEIQRRYDCVAGLSDHSGSIYPGIAAVSLGARIIEVHVVFSRDCYGPDTPASITIEELRKLVDAVTMIEAALRSPVDKDELANELAEVRKIFGRSVVAERGLQAGHEITERDLALKKPGGGLPPEMFDRLIGRRLRVAVHKDELQSEEMFEQ